VPSTAVTPRAPVLPIVRDLGSNIEIEINYPYSTYVRAGKFSQEILYDNITDITDYSKLNDFLEGNIDFPYSII